MNQKFCGNVYGASNYSNTVSTVTITIDNSTIEKSIFGGGNNGELKGDTNIIITGSIIKQSVYGGCNSNNVIGNTNVKVLSGNVTLDVFGGGNLGQIQGDTNLDVGDENNQNSNNSLTISGTLYAGGRGVTDEASKDIISSVTGNSTAKISGEYTEISTYGSIYLGPVDGVSNINFVKYRNNSSTDKYKTISGINKATNLNFESSYVQLLGGLVNITNINLPEGSGLLIAENSEILGNFAGGGVLYLKGEETLVIDGDIVDNGKRTSLTLNPKIIEDNYSTIQGGMDKPYIVVKGTDNTLTDSFAFYSGSPVKYEILNSRKAEDIDTTSYPEATSIYYIETDVNISDLINTFGSIQKGKYYTKSEFDTFKDFVMMANESITFNASIEYTVTSGATAEFNNIQREFKIENTSTYEYIAFPEKTRLLLVTEDGIYGYIVTNEDFESGIDTIPLDKLKKLETGESYVQKSNVSNSDLITTGNTKSYKETFQFILDFSNCEFNSALLTSSYRGYGLIKFGDSQNEDLLERYSFDTKNVFNIEKIIPTFDLSSNKAVYVKNNDINISGKMNILSSKFENSEYVDGKDLYGIAKLQDESGNILSIPVGTKLNINGDISIITTKNSGGILVNTSQLRDLSNGDINSDFSIIIDMKDTLYSNISTGKYKFVMDYYVYENNCLIGNKIGTLKTDFINLITSNLSNIGIKMELVEDENIVNPQLIEKVGESRTLKLTTGIGIISPYSEIIVQKKTGPFKYENCTKNEISLSTNKVTSFNENIEVRFDGDLLENGTYRIIAKVYDGNSNYYSDAVMNFIVNK